MTTSRKFKVWLDSGANSCSNNETFVTLEELGYSSEEWDATPEAEQEQAMKEIAFQWADWGYAELTPGEDDDL